MPLTDILSRHNELSRKSYSHEILVRGEDLEACKKKVLKFFQYYQLVRYSGITIEESGSVPATDRGFNSRLQEAIRQNREILSGMIKELQAENVITLADLERLPQGYKSKMLHIITHFLDGFFGVDTHFFNLEEDSHWVSDELKETIKAESPSFWLLAVDTEP